MRQSEYEEEQTLSHLWRCDAVEEEEARAEIEAEEEETLEQLTDTMEVTA